jgi:hypothetical protein
MSDESVIALAALVVSGLIGIASLGFSFWNSHAERQQHLAEREQEYQEWYRRTLFERRLQAAQQAYAWWTRLNQAVAAAGHRGEPEARENDTVRQFGRKAREWYDDNSFYLDDPEARLSVFVGLTNCAVSWSGAPDNVMQESLDETFKWVRNLAADLLGSEKASRLAGEKK